MTQASSVQHRLFLYSINRSQHLCQFTLLVQTGNNVATADQLAADIKLGISRPVRISLKRLAKLRVFKNINVHKLGMASAQYLHCLAGKAALRKIR